MMEKHKKISGCILKIFIVIIIIFGGALDAKAGSKAIHVTSPNGGEKWEIGKTYSIIWNSLGYDKVRINIDCKSHSTGAILNVPSGVFGGTYSFTVPTNWSVENQCKAQVSENLSMLINNINGVNYDMSDNYFNIILVKPITVLSPNGGEQWITGSMVNVKWKRNSMPIQANGLARVAINRGDGPTKVLAEGVEDESGYNFEVPTWLDVGSDYKIIVTSYGYGDNLSDESDNYFSVVLQPVPMPAPTPAPTPSVCIFPDGTLVKLPNDPKIYIIRDCKKVWIQTIEEFNRGGYKWSDVNELPSGTVNSIPDTSVTSNSKNIPEGAIIQAIGDSDVYIVKYVGAKKFKRLILSPSVFKSYGHLKWENIIKVDKATLDSFTTSSLVKSENGRIYKLVPNGDVGLRNHIKDMIAFLRLAFDMDSVYQINTKDENSYALGQELQ